MKFLTLILCLLCFSANAFYPMQSKEGYELRLIAKLEAPDWTEPKLEGQIVSVKLSDKFSVGGLFSLGIDEEDPAKSHAGVQTTYKVNQYIDIAVAGKLSNLKELGGELLVSGNIPYNNHLLKPFVKTDHKVLTEVGAVYYFSVKKIGFHIGAAMQPDFKIKKIRNVGLFFGASFEDAGDLIGLVGKGA